MRSALCILALLILGACAIAAKVDELKQLALSSRDHVIPLDDAAFDKYVAARGRNYHWVVFMTARHMVDKPQFHLPKVRAEFGKVAMLYRRQEAVEGAAPVFFGVVELTDSKSMLDKLRVDMLPYIMRFGPEWAPRSKSDYSLPRDDTMTPREYDELPWQASLIGSFITARTGVEFPSLNRPSFVRTWAFPVVAVLCLLPGTMGLYRLAQSPIIRDVRLQCLASLLVYWFATSGGLYNIIRGMPLLIPRQGKAQLFMDGQGQLGAEGFILGSLHMITAMALAASMYVVPKLQSKHTRQNALVLLYLVAGTAAYYVFRLYSWKIGYRLRFFLW